MQLKGFRAFKRSPIPLAGPSVLLTGPSVPVRGPQFPLHGHWFPLQAFGSSCGTLLKAFSLKSGLFFTIKGPRDEGMTGVGGGRGFGRRIF